MAEKSIDAEYYFDYKIIRIFGDEKEIKTPRLYFERDYKKSNLSYCMFAVFDEWVDKMDIYSAIKEKSADVKREQLAKLRYDSVSVVYDISDIRCVGLCDEQSEQYRRAEIKPPETYMEFEKYYPACRMEIDSKITNDHSGTGVITMFRHTADGVEAVARFFIAVNFTFKRKIEYYLERSGNRVNVRFVCKKTKKNDTSRPRELKVSLVYAPGRLPCLKSDMSVNRVESAEGADYCTLDFSQSYEQRVQFELQSVSERGADNYFSLGFYDPAICNYYILDCMSNNTLPKSGERTLPTRGYSCPYCHGRVSMNMASYGGYKRGGIACSSSGTAGEIAVRAANGAPRRHSIYCKQDLSQDKKSLQANFSRLLPDDFMKYRPFKIVMMGSPRAGKTTYISRFFGMMFTGSETVDFNMLMAKNSLRKLKIDLLKAPIPQVTPGGEDRNKDWTAEQKEYTDRVISLEYGQYPAATDKKDYSAYPFITKVNGNALVSFYDVAGEDAKTKNVLGKIGNSERRENDKDIIGVFCIVNANKNVGDNSAVIDQIKNSGISKSCPIAVIVAKSDLIAKNLDPNCRCLRSDYLPDEVRGKFRYEGSNLEREINLASEEIKSYLIEEKLYPWFEGNPDDKDKAKDDVQFKNVKCFAASSFNFFNSIHKDGDSPDQPGKVSFECSSKRLELPFVWMLKQFGVIE